MRAEGWGWRHAGRAEWAVRGLDLTIAPGERVLLLGASGAGKSTLVHAFAGVLGGSDEGEQEGSLTVGGRLPADSRGLTGLVLQDPDSQVALARIGDDIAFGCENLGVPRDEIWRRVDEAMEAVGLDLPLDRPTSALSGGQKQRVALAGVLAMRPEVVLLDEPTANLDPAGVAEVRDAVAAVVRSSNSTFVVIEHRVDVWLDVVDRVIVLDPGGGVLADGDPATVLRERGAELARGGVWVPGFDPLQGRPARQAAAAPAPAAATDARPTLLATADLAVGRTPAAVAARGLDLDVARASALALTGPNGAGKSTLALTIAGLLEPLGGTLRARPALTGDPVPAAAEAVPPAADSDVPVAEGPRARADERRHRREVRRARRRGGTHGRALGEHPFAWPSRELLTRIGTVFQDPEHQFVTGTVRGELEVALRALRLDAAEIDARVTEVAGRLRLDGLLTANPYTLSGGEKRRLSVASVLVARPAVLVLDEPTFGQDSRTWAELVRLLGEQLDRGTAVVAVTHDRAFIEALADRELEVRPAEGSGA
ncbi:ABC transporter ATP-binding protein [Herbiconiux sp. VKM Ac-1786]|uniref:ABC transporter ATP-binding protein n=1 Tax=Herbiconiux sp. VKM Ac-1786 TaxID=2783824 RepID=UPI001E56414B|nr:ATP-binding cassette domain-containing protein [Herbiconiux sp. VKM Ac-1786]